ncbi:MAG: UDP-N-acetylmuramoyl-L-alanyl-D-glutamate--2,6-diaminopimelate ligase [Gemmatimonadota bacterium]
MLATLSITERLEARGLAPRWRGAPPAAFVHLALDSRKVGEGDLFCAVRGVTADGHDHLAAASAAGATGAVVQAEAPGLELPQLVVSDSRVAATHLASLALGDPADHLSVVGVTGTNGKTTTAWILRHLLASRGPAGAVGTLGIMDPGGSIRPGRLTTPGPLEAMEALAELRDAGCEVVAMEVSSHALDQHRIDGIGFRCAVFTNLTREHLDYHADMAAYRAAKLRLAELVRPAGALLVLGEEPAWTELRHRDGAVTYGTDPSADVRAEDMRSVAAGSAWRLVTPEGEAEVRRLPLPGAFNVVNALAAAAAARALGLEVGEIAAALESLPQVPGRMEILGREPALVVRDYAHTPDALERALSALRPLASGRLFLVFGCGGDRDRGKRPLMGCIASEGADVVVVTSDNPRSEDPAHIAAEVLADLPPRRAEVELDREAAIERVLADAGVGDVVLLAGKGHEAYQEVGDERHPFDEAAVVARWLGEAAP